MTSTNKTSFKGIWVTRSSALSDDETALFGPAAPLVFHAPVLTFSGIALAEQPAITPGQAHLVFTSEHGVKFLHQQWPDARKIPCSAVGEHTARVAHAAGFVVVHIGKGNASDILPYLAHNLDKDTQILVAGADEPAFPLAEHARALGRHAQHVPVYTSTTCPALPENIVAAIQSGQMDSVFLSSRKGALAFVELMKKYGLQSHLPQLDLYALSDAVAASVANLPRSSLHVASAPRMPLLIHAWLEYKAKP